ETRVERQCTIDQSDHCADILAEKGQRKSGLGESARIIVSHLQGSPGKIAALLTVLPRIFAPAVRAASNIVVRGPSERGTVTWVARDRLLHQTERLGDRPRRKHHRIGAQVKVVGREITGWAAGRAGPLSGL